MSRFDQVDSIKVLQVLDYVLDKRLSEDQLKRNRFLINVLDIFYVIIGKICLKLNVKDNMFFRDYRLFGEKMGFIKDVIRDLERKDNFIDELFKMWFIKFKVIV